MEAQTLGTRIRRARERARLTQAQLAERLKVDRRTVDNWENDRTKPRSILGAIEEELGPLYGEPETPAEPEDESETYRRAVREILDLKISDTQKSELIARVTEMYKDAGRRHGGGGIGSQRNAV
jgi:transcriptional regulator with XRE-family HTH domain